VDAARDRFSGTTEENATHGSVIRAVLMNSADKQVFNNYDNGQFLDNGVVTTVQAKDANVGAGQLDLDAAFDQFLSGTTDLDGLDGGEVGVVGWDFGRVADGQEQFYTVDQQLAANTTLTVTLSWFAEYGIVTTPGAEALFNDRFADLDLIVYELDSAGNIIGTLAQSISQFQSTEHLSFDLSGDTYVGFGVRVFGENWDFGSNETATDFALAFAGTAVPAPFGGVVLAFGGLFAARRRRG